MRQLVEIESDLIFSLDIVPIKYAPDSGKMNACLQKGIHRKSFVWNVIKFGANLSYSWVTQLKSSTLQCSMNFFIVQVTTPVCVSSNERCVHPQQKLMECSVFIEFQSAIKVFVKDSNQFLSVVKSDWLSCKHLF